MKDNSLFNIFPLGFNWETIDPFLFCVHHQDAYPKGNDQLGPAVSLAGRNIGQDFIPRDGWRMYHGDVVPGFPAHPHRGFETVTIVLDGFVDHSDSNGAGGRYGNGDVQWMTAGSGLQHAEMFPLLNPEGSNRMELFQVWLNLPARSKFVQPHYKMLWAEDMSRLSSTDAQGRRTTVTLIAGELDGCKALSPAPDSWAADPDNQTAIWIINMEQGAGWALPVVPEGVRRVLYFFEGAELEVAGSRIPAYHGLELLTGAEMPLQAGTEPVRLLLLQSRPIDEPVAQYGPFVMNTEMEIRQAFNDYRQTEFGGWPWQRHDPVYPRSAGRFARYADGREEKKDQ